MAEAAIRVERRGGVVRCTLDRPPLNLLEPGLIGSLHATFETLAADPTVRVGDVALEVGSDLAVASPSRPAGATPSPTATASPGASPTSPQTSSAVTPAHFLPQSYDPTPCPAAGQ